jgi:hypothetical protein
MGSSDPLAAGFEIRFGSLNFQATGNDYLMCINNRDKLHLWQSTGSGPVPATPAADAPAPAREDAMGSSAPRCRQHSGQRSLQARMERRRRAARAAAQCNAPASGTTATPIGECEAPEPRFPHGMHNAATAYASSASTDVAAYKDLPDHHLLAVPPLVSCPPPPRDLARVCGLGFLRCAKPGDVPAVPRRRGLQVRLLRHLQRW